MAEKKFEVHKHTHIHVGETHYHPLGAENPHGPGIPMRTARLTPIRIAHGFTGPVQAGKTRISGNPKAHRLGARKSKSI